MRVLGATGGAAAAIGAMDAWGMMMASAAEAPPTLSVAGEHLSYMTGWMAGAIESAWLQIEKIHDQVQARQGRDARQAV